MPRSIQINIPLFALINDSELKRDFITLLKGRDEILADEKQRTIDGEIVQMLHAILFDIGEDGAAVWKIPHPIDDELCDQLRIEKIVSMLNENDRKEKDHLNAKYVGKKISGLGLISKQILTRKSDYHKKSAILFDSHRLAVIFRNYGLPVPFDFSLDQIDQSGKSSNLDGLGRSNDNLAEHIKENTIDQAKSNDFNNIDEWSIWSKENCENGGENLNGYYSDHAENKTVAVDEVF